MSEGKDSVRCHVCASRSVRMLAGLVSEVDGKEYAAVRCTTCGLLFAHPTPELSFEDLQGVYGSNYTKELRTPEEDPRTLQVLRNATARQMELVERHVSVGRALNVGAMSGAAAALAERGWSLRVVEVSGFAAETARTRWGYDVIVSRLEDLPCPPQSFDFVKLGHVIEHLSSPLIGLQAVARVLRPGGVVLIDTDNASGLRSVMEYAVRRALGERFAEKLVRMATGKNLKKRYGRLIPPVHLHIFAEKSLIRVLHETGFEVIWVRKPAWGDPVWFPITTLTGLSLAERLFLGLDKIGAWFGHGELLSILARKRS